MADNDLRREIEALKAQIEALNRTRPTPDDTPEEAPPGAAADGADGEPAENPGDDLMAHVHEVIDELGEQLRDANPATLLVVFSLGVLFGRLLPR